MVGELGMKSPIFKPTHPRPDLCDGAHHRRWWWKQRWAAIATKHGLFQSSKAEVIALKSISPKELGAMIPRHRYPTDKNHGFTVLPKPRMRHRKIQLPKRPWGSKMIPWAGIPCPEKNLFFRGNKSLCSEQLICWTTRKVRYPWTWPCRAETTDPHGLTMFFPYLQHGQFCTHFQNAKIRGNVGGLFFGSVAVSFQPHQIFVGLHGVSVY